MSWPEVPIGEACDLVNGRAFKPSDWVQAGLPIVRIQNLNDETAAFNRFDGPVRDRFLIDSGALLFSWSGTPGTSFGAFFWHRGPAILNQHIFHVRCRDGVDANYFRYALNARLDRIIAQAHGGVGLQHITKDKLEATTVPLPPRPEQQRRIAEILDKAEAIRRKRKETIALTEELLRSAFLEMFGDPVTNPKGWPVKSVLELCDSTQYGTSAKASEQPKGTPVLRMNNITYRGGVDLRDMKWVELTEAEREKLDLRDGDVLFNRTNSLELVGKAAAWRNGPGYTFAGYLVRLRPNARLATGDYISGALNSASGKRLLMAVAKPSINMANISASNLSRVAIASPPVSLQKKYGTVAAAIQDVRARSLRSLSEADGLMASLVQRAFRGDGSSNERPAHHYDAVGV